MADSRLEQVRRLEELVSKQEARIQQAYDQYVDEATSENIIDRLTRALQDGDIEGFMRILSPYINAVGNAMAIVYTDAAIDMAREIVIVIPNLPAPALETAREVAEEALKPRPTVSVGFDPSHPRAVEQMRTIKLDLVRQITNTERENIRQTMIQALDEGWGARKAAQRLTQTIGLTDTQRKHVDNYRTYLESRNARALSLKLRDKRFDSQVERAIESKKPLTEKQIEMMVSAYHKRYIRYRAELIARTEATRAVSQARMESIEQMMEATGLERDAIKRRWNHTHDHRTRSFHGIMEERVVGMDEPFIDGRGNRLMYPGDPNAPAETTVQCRCVMTIQTS